MEARKEFYVVTDVFKMDLCGRAVAVYSYLSYCANKEGECFPSVRRIANACGMSENTARKMINELVSKGVISSTPRIMKTEQGNRQTTNVYKLLVDRGPRKKAPKDKLPELSELIKNAADKPPAEDKPKPAKKPIKASVGTAKARPDDDDVGLEYLLERLDLHRYYSDESACKALELAITDMWFANETTVCGETVNKYRMRKRLNELDIDSVDEIMELLSNDDVNNQTAYIKSCIFNAPMRVNARIAIQTANMRRNNREVRELKKLAEDRGLTIEELLAKKLNGGK